MILDNYDDFNFMVILLFLFFILMSFIIMIMINAKSKAKYNQMYQLQNNPQTTISSMYPQITGQKCLPNATDGQCSYSISI
jgi:hypothetical protein